MMIARWMPGHIIVLQLIVCACLGAGCSRHRAPGSIDESGPPVRGGTLEVVGRSDVDHLTTTSAYVAPTMWLFRTFTRQLLAYPTADDFATKTSPVPDLALEVPTRGNGGISADGCSYTFHLRRGVLWNSSSPREVTAHDVVRAFKLLCNPVNPVGAPGYYTSTIAGMDQYCDQFARVPGTIAAIRDFVNTQNLEGIRVDDDFTVIIRLQTAAPDFLSLVAMPFASPVPSEYLDYLPDSPEFRQHTLSNGPYRISRYIQDREILLDRNPVWDPRSDPIRSAYIDRIHLRLGIDVQLQHLQIEAGTADLSFDDVVPRAELASLLATGDSTPWLSPPGNAYLGFQFLAFNHVGPNNRHALGKRQVRQAIALAVDKSAVMQLTGGPSVARPLRQAVASCAAGYRNGADQYVTPDDRGDPVAARTLLAEAGYPEGLTLTLEYATIESRPLVAQALQASLARAGIDIHLLPGTFADTYSRVLTNPENAQRGVWDIALTGWIPDWRGDNNGRSVIEPLFDGRHFGQNTQNYGGYSSRYVDASIDHATTALTVELAEQEWSNAARRLMDDVALVPLVEYKVAYARSQRVCNCTWDALGVNCDLTALWLADVASRPGGLR